MTYIVIWKDQPGQQVSTVVDANNVPVARDEDYLASNDIPVVDETVEIFDTLKRADGQKIAVTYYQARQSLGWDV